MAAGFGGGFSTRQQKQSSTRNMQAEVRPVKKPQPPLVVSPQSAQDRTTVKDQARALSKKNMPVVAAPTSPPFNPLPSSDAFQTLPGEAQQQLRTGYGAGGFEGVVNAVGPDWYDIPEWQRTQILTGVRR